MSLIDALAADPPRVHHGRPCEFGRWVASLSDEEADAVRAALDSVKTNSWLADTISRNGFVVSATTIAKHRRGQCISCRS